MQGGEEGSLLGMVQPMGFSNQRVALEYAWYAEDGCGMALLSAFEQWAQRMGASAQSRQLEEQRRRDSIYRSGSGYDYTRYGPRSPIFGSLD